MLHDDTLTEIPAPVAPSAAPSAGAVTHGDGPVGIPLGKLAVDEGLVTQLQLAGAFSEQFSTGERLGEILQHRGLLTDADVSRLLALQKGLRFVDDGDVLALETRDDSLPAGAALVTLGSGERAVAVADPGDALIDEIRGLLGFGVQIAVVSGTRFGRMLEGDAKPLVRMMKPPARRSEDRPELSGGPQDAARNGDRSWARPSLCTPARAENGGGRDDGGVEPLVGTVIHEIDRRPTPHGAVHRPQRDQHSAHAADALRRTVAELEGNLAETSADLDRARSVAAELERRLDEATAELAATRRELDDARSAGESELASLRAAVAQRDAREADLREKLGGLASLLQVPAPDDAGTPGS